MIVKSFHMPAVLYSKFLTGEGGVPNIPQSTDIWRYAGGLRRSECNALAETPDEPGEPSKTNFEVDCVLVCFLGTIKEHVPGLRRRCRTEVTNRPEQ